MSDLLPSSAHDDDHNRAQNGERLVHPDVQYEEADVAVRPVAAVLLAIALVFVGVGLVSWWLLNMNKSDADRASQAPQYSESAERLPAAPRLEPLDRTETTATSEVFAKQLVFEHILHSYGVSPDEGFVHIPIEQAMKLVVADLTIRQGDKKPPAKSFGLMGGGESNSGSLYSEAPSWLQEKE